MMRGDISIDRMFPCNRGYNQRSDSNHDDDDGWWYGVYCIINLDMRANDGNSDDNQRAIAVTVKRDRRWRQYRRVVTVDDIDGRRSNGYVVIMFIRICVDLLDRQCDVQVYGVGVTTPKPTQGMVH